MKPSSLNPLDSLAPLTDHPEDSIECKFLFKRQIYRACHIQVPDVPQRLPAVTCDGQYYSFFKVIPDPEKLVAVMARLSKREQQVAVTNTSRGYGLWVYEPQAIYSPPSQNPGHTIQLVRGPAPCHVVVGAGAYRYCSFVVPDVEKPMAGIEYRHSLYSIYKQDELAEMVIPLAGKLNQRGDETVLTMAADQYILAVKEPTGFLVDR